MWSRVAEISLRILSVLLSAFVSYGAGKKAVQSDIKDGIIDDANKRKDIEIEIAKSHADPDARKRLRDKWHE